MRIVVERNFVQVLGTLWLPAVTGATEYPLRKYDLDNIGKFTRANVARWLTTNAGDFQRVLDFYATAGDVEIPWTSEDNEMEYYDCMYPMEDER